MPLVPGVRGGRALTGTSREHDHEGMTTNFLHHVTRQAATSAAPRSALLAADATVLGLDGTPVAADPWEQVRADA